MNQQLDRTPKWEIKKSDGTLLARGALGKHSRKALKRFWSDNRDILLAEPAAFKRRNKSDVEITLCPANFEVIYKTRQGEALVAHDSANISEQRKRICAISSYFLAEDKAEAEQSLRVTVRSESYTGNYDQSGTTKSQKMLAGIFGAIAVGGIAIGAPGTALMFAAASYASFRFPKLFDMSITSFVAAGISARIIYHNTCEYFQQLSQNPEALAGAASLLSIIPIIEGIRAIGVRHMHKLEEAMFHLKSQREGKDG